MMKLPMPFGNPKTRPNHSGVDFAHPLGTVIRASDDGKVANRTTNSRGGNMVWIQYDNGTRAGYGHLPNGFPGTPAIGTRVKYGDRIGKVGLTGNTTGPHVHVEVSGDATTEGFYRHFDRTDWVGKDHGKAPDPVPSDKEEREDMFVNIQGKAGVRSGGAYYIEGGKATFLGGTLDNVPNLSFDQGTALSKRVSGIG